MLEQSYSYVTAASLLCGVAILIFLRDRPWEDRLLAAALPVLVPPLFLVTFVKSAIGTFSFFSAARLAPAIGAVMGYGLYSPVDDGPVFNTIYGPMAYLVYVPAALARSPGGALMIAGAIRTLFYFAPLFLLVLVAARADRSRADYVPAALACLAIVAVTFMLGATNYMATEIHSDAPSLGFGMLSCVLLLNAGTTTNGRSLFWPGLFAAMAVWVKQTEAPIVLAQCIYLLIVAGRAAALRYLAIAAGCGLVLGALFVVAFGFGPMWLNMFFIPSQHAVDDRIGLALANLLLSYALFVPFLIIATLPFDRDSGIPVVRRIADKVWFLPALVAMLLIPTSLLGYLKVGGWVNSFHGLYYLIGATAAALAWPGSAGPASRWTGLRRWTLLISTAFVTTQVFPMLRQYPVAVEAMAGKHPSQTAYEYALNHPDEVYFPWLPLASLMADRKLYHFDFGLRDRQNAGIMTSFEHFRAYLPNRMKHVAMPSGGNFYAETFRLPDEDYFFLNYADRFGPGALVRPPGLEDFHVIEFRTR